jgi:hypothetical protein
MTDVSPRVSPWLSTSGWLLGALLFIRLAQVLPCCQSPSLEVALRSHICGENVVNPCPRYEDSAPR